jgi:hypothetical protein
VRKGGHRIRLPGDPRLRENAEAYQRVLVALGLPLQSAPPPAEALHLYVKQAAHGPIKVGRSGDPEQRLIGLQVGAAGKVTLVATFPWRGDEERSIHAAMHAHRITGEWFNCTPAATHPRR